MKDSCKFGLMTMALWIVFVITLVSGYAFYNNYSFFEYFVDEETNGVVSGLFSTAWAIAWFFIGSHGRNKYITMCKYYSQNNPQVDPSEVQRTIKTYYFTKLAKILTVVFSTAVPWWWIVKMIQTGGTYPSVKDYIVTFVLVILSTSCYWYYKRNKNIIESYQG